MPKFIIFIFKEQHHTALLGQTVTKCQPFFVKREWKKWVPEATGKTFCIFMRIVHRFPPKKLHICKSITGERFFVWLKAKNRSPHNFPNLTAEKGKEPAWTEKRGLGKADFSSICPASAYIKSLPHLHENPHDAYPYPHGMPYHGFPCPPERKQKKETGDITSKGKPPWLAYSRAKPWPERYEPFSESRIWHFGKKPVRPFTSLPWASKKLRQDGLELSPRTCHGKVLPQGNIDEASPVHLLQHRNQPVPKSV